MKLRLKAAIIVSMMACLVSFGANAQPGIIEAPIHFAVKHYMNDYFMFTASMPDGLRELYDNWNPNSVLTIKLQVDYKFDEGQWHYKPSWDEAKFGLPNSLSTSFVRGQTYITSTRASLSSMFPEDAQALQEVKGSVWDFPKQLLAFRVRFVTTLDGGKAYEYSDWSAGYVYHKDIYVEPNYLIDNKPELIEAIVEKNSGGQPFLKIRTGRIPYQVQELNAMAGDGMMTEIWMRKSGEKDFKLINSSFFRVEYILVGVDDYFDKSKAGYEEESYEIKIRYVLNNLSKYPQAGRNDVIYSPFSNIFAHNMPAWANASKWATTELKEADEVGLIPVILRGKDLTRPITREEFAELAVLLY